MNVELSDDAYRSLASDEKLLQVETSIVFMNL